MVYNLKNIEIRLIFSSIYHSLTNNNVVTKTNITKNKSEACLRNLIQTLKIKQHVAVNNMEANYFISDITFKERKKSTLNQSLEED